MLFQLLAFSVEPPHNNFFDVDIGQVVIWGTMLIGMGISWQKSVGRYEKNAAANKQTQIELDEVKREVKQLQTIEGENSILLARIDERSGFMVEADKEIKHELRLLTERNTRLDQK